MTPRTVVLPVDGTNNVESFTLPPAIDFKVQSVYVEFDGSTGSVTPELSISEQSGQVIARKRQSEATDAVNPASATWALRLADDIQGPPGPSGTMLGVQAQRVIDFNVPSGYTAVSFTQTDFDTSGFWSGGTPARFTIPAGLGGWYMSVVRYQMTSVVTNDWTDVNWQQNGGSHQGVAVMRNPGPNGGDLETGTRIDHFADGDTLDWSVYNNSLSTLTVDFVWAAIILLPGIS